MRHAIPTQNSFLYLATVLLIGLSSCLPSFVADTSFDGTVDFQVYHTFALVEPTAAGSSADPTQFEPLFDRRVRDAVAAELVKKGLKPDAQDPDLLVAYDLAVAQAPAAAAESPDFGYSYWYGYRFNYNTTDFPNYRPIGRYPVGTMFIDLIDATSNELVWRGIVAGDIDAKQTEESKIRRAIAAMLAQYPPGTM
ncbi:DUF4136 domain-containing protein [Pontibacter sp. JH31]|uniref:DUF4136 domain-containing protein n=1 Tax=Pontibacter aquaedesilientis TaxID=2766980 RepID=A0ABR7XFZ6_9BACT|nr:DUF4136 domain-containing protein [Pontibacter aquaedesilientis]MBD1397208.1 DUF4136 domain-containing protein [Pontibacter aquaedesilientis]